MLTLCVAAVGAGGGVIAAQSKGEETSVSASEDAGVDAVDPVDESLQACADIWNNGNTNKESVASFSMVAQTENPTAYVHVGFSELFRDRCMITVANPSTLLAQQYLQDGGASWSIAPAWTGSVNDLDESNLPWNARMAQDGTITVL
ncbi:hypothetical protein ACFW2D_09845 [Streptomyces sp. NPDC058914]|uniref:hypothetical protein n=1 Tax=Streptomyces sp. NPDC058914 TaxID=3346671 RepID=UPI00369035E8